MNDEMKRRVFIGTSIAALAGFPFVLRSMRGNRPEVSKSDFQINLDRCRRLIKFKTEPAEGPEVFKWKITPPDKEVKYLSFLESKCVPFGESRDRLPDVFYFSEGSMNTFMTKEEETMISGKDWRRTEFWPFETIRHPQQEFTLWLKNGKLVQVRNKNDKRKIYLERSFVRQLAMNDLFPQIRIGTETERDVARILPFD